MPTARELLDQADALMRRNRSSTPDDIPVLTEALPRETAAQMTQSDLLAEDLVESRARFDATPAVSDGLDDVPVLTDVVEEVEVPSVVDPIEPGGEPSAWLDFDDDGARSIIDGAADSIIVVPDIEPHERGREETDVERDLDCELQPAGHHHGVFAEPRTAQLEDARDGSASMAEEPEEGVLIEEPTASQDEEVVVVGLAAQPDESVVAEEFAAQPDESVVGEEFAAQLDESDVLEQTAARPEEFAGIDVIDLFAQPVIEETTTSAPALFAQDDARWTVMAEEIQMQVLQRIDLFTDTGLREQLGVHLQPIVDRASAELVATINREVGELLRAYVAEAIEREIERWRQDNLR